MNTQYDLIAGGIVDVDKSMLANISKGDLLIIIVKPVDNEMPLAVKKMELTGIPQQFAITSEDIISKDSEINENVAILARIEKDNDLIRLGPDDISSQTSTIKKGDTNIKLILNKKGL